MFVFVVTTNDLIATLTFNRLKKRNTLNVEALLEMESHLQTVQDDRRVHVLIVTGTDNSFCPGADLSAVKDITDPKERQCIFHVQGICRTSLTARAAMQFRGLEQVTIAAIKAMR